MTGYENMEFWALESFEMFKIPGNKITFVKIPEIINFNQVDGAGIITKACINAMNGNRGLYSFAPRTIIEYFESEL